MAVSTKNDELEVAGIRLQITGEAEFVKSLQTSAKQSAALKNELKLLEVQTTSAGKNGAEYLRAKSEALSGSIAVQTERTKNLKAALEAATKEGKTDANVTADLEKSILASELATAKLTKSLNETNAQLSKATNEALLHAKAQKEMGEKLEATGKQVKDAGGNMTKYITAPAIAASAALAALIVNSVKSADAIQLASDKYGMSTDRIQELTYAGKDLDVEFDTMASSQSKLIKAMEAARNGTEAQSGAFAKLGISVTNSDGTLRDSNVVWGEVIDKLGQMPNETEASSAAMILLGKSAMDLNPLIKAGSARLSELSTEAHNTGAVLEEAKIKGLDAFGDSVEKIKVRVGTASSEVAVKMLPTLDKLIPIVSDKIVPAIGNFAETVGDLIVGFDNLDPVAKNVVATIAGLLLVAGPAVSLAGQGITFVGTLNTVLGAHKIAVATSAAATEGLAAAEGTAATAGAAMATTLAPILLIAAAVAAAGIAYEVITAKSRETTNAVMDMTKEVNASTDAYNKSIEGLNTSEAATKKMVDQLYVLESVENKSNAQKSEMKMLVSSLNKEVDGLSLVYDEQTDSLNQNKDAIYDLIDAKMEQLKMTAYEDRMKTAYEDQIKLQDEYTAAVERYKKADKEVTSVHFRSPWGGVAELAEYNSAYDALMAVTGAYDKTTESLGTTEAAYAELSGAAAKSGDAITSAGESSAASIEETAVAVEKSVSIMTDEFKKQLEAAKESQQKYYDDMKQATSDYYAELGGINDEGIKQDDLTIEQWNENRRQQIEDMENWRVNMVALASKVPDEFLQYLAELGPGQSTMIQGLVDATPEELDAYIQTWRDGITEASQVAYDLSDALTKAYGNPYSTWYTLGQSTIDGLIAGIKANAPGAYTAATEAAKGVANAYKKQSDQHSPSRVMRKIGQNDADGVILGLKDREGELLKQAAKLASITSGGYSIPAVSLGSIATSQALAGYASQNIATTNNSTVDSSTVINMAGAVFNVRKDSDIDAIAEALALRVGYSRKAVGAS